MIDSASWQSFLENLVNGNEGGVERFISKHYWEIDDVPKSFWKQYDDLGAPYFSTSDFGSMRVKEIRSPNYGEKRIIAINALEQEDYGTFKKVVDRIFPVRLCKREHTLYHGLLPMKNGTASNDHEWLTPPEYVDKLESILEKGLIPSTNRKHNFSDPEIPAAYFSTGINQGYPWGPVVVVTHSAHIEEPVFIEGLGNPFTQDSTDRGHLIYSKKPIIPSQLFKVWLKPFEDAGYYSKSDYEQIVTELNKRKIDYTISPCKSGCELSYHKIVPQMIRV